jgi:hypothetical protein
VNINLEETVKLMCQDTLLNKHNHKSDLILSRMKKGLSLDEAFKLPKKYNRISESPMSNRISEMVKDPEINVHKIRRDVIRKRVYDCGWSVTEAFSTPTHKKRVFDKDMLELAAKHGITSDIYRKRLNRGWSSEKAATTPKMTPSQAGSVGRKKSKWGSPNQVSGIKNLIV